MPHIFRFHAGRNNNIYDWKSSDKILPADVREVMDKTNILTSAAGTSIPTPIARLFLFKTAFEIVAAQVRDNKVDSKGIYGKNKTISIPPAVAPLKLQNKNSALKKYGLKNKNRVRVLWLARVTGVKNPQRVIEIAKRLPEIDFYMAGGGDLLERIKKQAPRNLKVLGWQDAKSILPIADIFLSTSENEGMPIALIEAQLAAIPVVATNVGSVPEVILHNKSGLICSKSNDELIAAIKKLAQNKSLRSKFGKAGNAHALKSFSEKNLISAHKRLYLKLK